MPKFINKDQLDKLAKSLNSKSKAVVSEEEQRAQAAEQALQTEIETTRDMFGGKSIVYITQAEYDSLSEKEQNDNTKAYFITDAKDLSHEHNNKDLLDNFGARNITIGNSSKTFDGSKNISYTLSDIGAAESGHTHDGRYYTESEVNTKLSDLQTEVNADIKAEENRAKAAETSLQTAIDGKANKSHGNHVPKTQTANNAIFLRCDNTWATVTPDNIGAAEKSHGTHVTYSTTVPKANGTASVGSEASVARGDHVHPAQTSVSGNAGTATALQNARTITIGNQSNSFDGTANISYSIADIGAAPASHNHDGRYYTEAEVDVKIGNLQSEIDSDVKVETDRAMEVEAELQAAIGGKANASHNHNDLYYTESEMNTKLAAKADKEHDHDDDYYTQTEIDGKIETINTAINGKANASHGNHVPTTETANNARFLRNDNTWATITPGNIGAAKSSHGTHVTWSTTVPKANGEATIGSETTVARGDHVHPLQESVEKLTTARTITIGNQGVDFDGSANIDFTLGDIGAAAAGHNHDERYYTEAEINTKVTNLQAEIDADVKVEADRAKKVEAALEAAIGGKAASGHTHDDRYFTETEVTNKLATKSDVGHDHDDDYYTETEIDGKIETLETAIDGKANASHGNHVPKVQTADNKVFLRNDNTWATITPENIGAANSSHGTHVTWATNAPKAPAATAAVGSVNRVAREDHVHPVQTDVTGNAGTATKLAEAKSITIGNASQSFDGSANISYTLADIGAATSGHNHDSRYYTETEINTKITELQAEIDADVKVETDRAKEVEAELQAAIDNKAENGHNHDSRYFTEKEVTNKLATKSDVGHTHDDIYYTETEIDGKITSINTAISGKADKSHGNHVPATQTANNKVFLRNDNTWATITPENIGAAAESHGTHVTYATAAPKANGTAAVGTSSKVAREDHVHPLQTSVSGNAGSADVLSTARTITIGNKGLEFDGSDNLTYTLSDIGAAASGHTHKYAGSSSAGGAANKVANSIKVQLNGGTTEGTNQFTFDGSAAKTINITYSNIGAAKSSHGTHVTYATATPLANGTAAIGTSNKVAREDHVHPLQETITGNAGSADILSTARTITIGEKGLEFDGSENLTYTLAEIGAAAASHSHDGRYYTESEINTKVTNLQKEIDADVKVEADRAKEVEQSLQAAIDGKANASHGNHVPTTQTASNKVFLRNDNTWATVTPANIGAAASSHTHDDRYFTETEINSKITTINTAISNAQTAAQNYADTKIAALVDSAPDALNTLNELATAITDHKDVYDAYVEEIDSKLAGKSDTGHTHKYAGSSSAGGAATSANKVNSNLVVKLNSGSTEGTNLFTFNGSTAKTINITPDNIGAAKSSHGTHVTWATNAPSANGTAAVGSVARVAREDHVHPLQTTVSGNAGSATKLQTARTIKIGNQSNNFNGTGNITYTAADMGLVRGDNVSATLPATAGWYRVAQTTTSMGAQVGLFIIREKLSGYHSEAIITAGTSHGQNPTIQQLAYTCYSTKSLTKARLVYLVDNSGTNAYLEVYSSAAKAIELTVEMIGEIGWTLLTPAAGSIPTSYTSKELTFAANKIVANINGSVSGNADSATKLATARNLTIGSTGKTFNGTKDVSWTLDEIGAAAKSHTHNYAGSSSAGGAANSVANSLSIQLNGGTATTFNGSAAKSINITPSSIGAAASSHGTHVDYATAAPKANGTAAVGSSTKVAREDHVHPAQTSISGAAGSAATWTTARTITIGKTGKSVDGSANVSWTLTEIGAAAASHGNHVPATQTANNAIFLRNDNTWQKITPANIGAAASSHGDHVTYSTTTPKANGTASVGSESKVARGDHVHPLQTTVSGNAGTATKLQTARTITVNGVVSGSTSFDGSKNVTITTVANDITTITKALTVTTDWMDTGIAGTNLSTGTYAVQLYANGEGQGGQWDEYYSGIMSWFSGTTNSGEADEIFLHKAGHATNGESIFLRTIRQNSGDNKVVKLQIAASKAFTAEVSLQFKFKKLI